MNQIHWVLLITKGILHDRTVRRQALFWLVVAALALLGAGCSFLDAWLSVHPLLFLLFWGAVLWLTFTSALLALYDLLAVRSEAIRERQELKRRTLGENEREGESPNEPRP